MRQIEGIVLYASKSPCVWTARLVQVCDRLRTKSYLVGFEETWITVEVRQALQRFANGGAIRETLGDNAGLMRPLRYWIDERTGRFSYPVLVVPSSDEEQSMPFLRNPESGRVKDTVLTVVRKSIARIFELCDELREDASVTSLSHAWHILHYEVTRSQLANEAQKVKDQLVAPIIDQALANKREPLTGRTSCNEVDFAVE